METEFVTMAEAAPELTAKLIGLNNDHEKETSFLSPDAWRSLVAAAFAAWATADGAAFLIACDETSTYESPNFIWFKERYARFVYVDRIVVSPTARGRGLARALYDQLFERAGLAGYERVVCEVNTNPPNPGSDAFHEALAFHEVGRAHLPARGKSVRYLCRDLAGA